MKDLIKLKDKNVVVMGVANERSLAWGVAKSLFEVGANVIFTYRKERSLGKIEKLEYVPGTHTILKILLSLLRLKRILLFHIHLKPH